MELQISSEQFCKESCEVCNGKYYGVRVNEETFLGGIRRNVNRDVLQMQLSGRKEHYLVNAKALRRRLM